MKITGIELEKEDIKALISDGTYGNDEIGIDPKCTQEEWDDFKERINADRETNPIEYFEDFLAEWLFAGNVIQIDVNDGCQFMPEDPDYDEDLLGEFDLEKANQMLQKAFGDKAGRYHIMNYLNGQDDCCTGSFLLQYFAFGEEIVG